METITWITCQLLILLVTLGLLYLYQHFTKLRRLGIPGPAPWPLFGNLHQQFKRGLDKTDAEWFKKYGKVYGMYSGFRPTIVISDVNMIKKILVKDFSNFHDRPNNGNLPKLLRGALFFMQGHAWKRTRNIITPTFSSGKLRLFVPIINKCAETLADNLSALGGQPNVIVRQYFMNFTMDAIASTAFGLDIDSQKQPNEPFVSNIDRVFKFSPLAMILSISSAIAPGAGEWLYKVGLSQWPEEAVQFYDDVGQALIDERRKTKTDRVDFIQQLIDAEFDENSERNGTSEQDSNTATDRKPQKAKLRDDEINAQAFGIFLGGYETTASLLRYSAYCLALHPEIDPKLCAEIQECIGQNDPTYETVGQLKYMDQFIHEVLRCYPPIPRIIRSAHEDITIDGITIPKGASIQIPIWEIQRDPEIYEKPDVFDPDRFAQDKKGTTENATFLSFGIGPRHCIGMRLALMEAKIALVYVLRKVKFVKSDQTKYPLDLAHFGVLRPKTPVAVGIVNR